MNVYKYDTLREFILGNSRIYSDKVAFQFYDNSKELTNITYHQLTKDIEGLGTWLIRKGYKGQKIAIISENSYDWIRLFFAVAFSGNICVPLAKESGTEIIAENIKNADCSAIFYSKTSKKLIDSILEYEKTLSLDMYPMAEIDSYVLEGQGALADGDDSFALMKLTSDDLAAIYFTSGTTGSPKGVMLTQGNFAYDLQSATERLPDATSRHKLFVILPLTHVLSLCGMCFIFPNGRTAFICKGLKHFFADLEKIKPDIIVVVPLFLETVYKTVMSELEDSKYLFAYRMLCVFSNLLLKIGIDLRPVFFKKILEKLGGNMNTIISGGAPISQEILDEFRSWGLNVFVGYGITECAPIISVCDYKDSVPNSVGRPLDGVEVIIHNPDQKGIGEVCVKGPIVMKGYYNRPDETVAVFCDGMFHTGDLGYLDNNGFLYLTGRSKNLIILSNGENISPEMIENKINRIGAVKEVVVYQKGNNIVAEIFPDEKYIGKNDIKDVHAFLEGCMNDVNKDLPAYARISEVVIRKTEFVKNATRKIKRDTIGDVENAGKDN